MLTVLDAPLGAGDLEARAGAVGVVVLRPLALAEPGVVRLGPVDPPVPVSNTAWLFPSPLKTPSVLGRQRS